MTQPTPALPEYTTVAEISEELRIARMTVYRMIHRGELEAILLGARTYRVLTTSYLAYKARLHQDASRRVAAAGHVPHIPGQTEIPA